MNNTRSSVKTYYPTDDGELSKMAMAKHNNHLSMKVALNLRRLTSQKATGYTSSSVVMKNGLNQVCVLKQTNLFTQLRLSVVLK